MSGETYRESFSTAAGVTSLAMVDLLDLADPAVSVGDPFRGGARRELRLDVTAAVVVFDRRTHDPDNAWSRAMSRRVGPLGQPVAVDAKSDEGGIQREPQSPRERP